VMTPDLSNGYADRISDFEVELVDGVGHWIVHQRPQLVLDRVRAFFQRRNINYGGIFRRVVCVVYVSRSDCGVPQGLTRMRIGLPS
jgi:hypothetical protein